MAIDTITIIDTITWQQHLADAAALKRRVLGRAASRLRGPRYYDGFADAAHRFGARIYEISRERLARGTGTAVLYLYMYLVG